MSRPRIDAARAEDPDGETVSGLELPVPSAAVLRIRAVIEGPRDCDLILCGQIEIPLPIDTGVFGAIVVIPGAAQACWVGILIKELIRADGEASCEPIEVPTVSVSLGDWNAAGVINEVCRARIAVKKNVVQVTVGHALQHVRVTI